MKLGFDGAKEQPEIAWHSSQQELNLLCELLMNPSIEWAIRPTGTPPNYQSRISLLRFARCLDSRSLLRVQLRCDELAIEGDEGAFEKLAQSFQNYFGHGDTDERHLHLEYFDDNGLIDKTDASVIIVRE